MRGTGGSTALFLSVLVRPDRFPSAPSWCQAGESVSIAVGEAEHAGQFRITPGGPFRITRQGSRSQGKAPLNVRIPLDGLPHGVAPERRPQERAEHQVNDNGLLITLPVWGRPPPQRQAA
ncbi:MAG: hypothetical protein ACRYHQ_34335 [Janthinobacterium lividum]